MKYSASTRAQSLRSVGRSFAETIQLCQRVRASASRGQINGAINRWTSIYRWECLSLYLSIVSMRFWSEAQGEAFGSAGGPNDSGHSENTLITVEALPELKHCAGRRALLSSLCLSISVSPSFFLRMCEILGAMLVCLHNFLLQLACKLYKALPRIPRTRFQIQGSKFCATIFKKYPGIFVNL